MSSPLVMYSSNIRKCFGSSLPNRTPPIAGLINASTVLRYVTNVEGRRRDLTISSSHLSSQSFRYGVVWLDKRPERSYSSFLSFNRFSAMALVRPRATRRRRFPIAGSGGQFTRRPVSSSAFRIDATTSMCSSCHTTRTFLRVAKRVANNSNLKPSVATYEISRNQLNKAIFRITSTFIEEK